MGLKRRARPTCHRVVYRIGHDLDGAAVDIRFLAATWLLHGHCALALATAVVSRLFSILRLNPPASIEGLSPQDLDLLVATGPGVPGFELLGWSLGALVLVQFILRAASVAASADSRESSLNAAALTFIRVYVGL